MSAGTSEASDPVSTAFGLAIIAVAVWLIVRWVRKRAASGALPLKDVVWQAIKTLGSRLATWGRKTAASIHKLAKRSVEHSAKAKAARRAKNDRKRTETTTLTDIGPQRKAPRYCRLSSGGRLGIVGESYYGASIARALAGRVPGMAGDWQSGVYMMATLQREPTNVHDRDAVVVHLLGPKGRKEKAGYIDAESAPSWHGVLREVRKRKAIAVARASVYRGGGGNYSVVLHLGAPWSAMLRNEPPEGAEIFDADKEVVLDGVKDCQDVLGLYVDALVWATLSRSVIQSGKNAGQETLAVMINGQLAGHFPPGRAEPYLDIIEEGDLVACEANVRKGRKILEARVWMPQLHS